MPAEETKTHGYLKIILVCEPSNLVLHIDSIDTKNTQEDINQNTNEDKIKEDSEMSEIEAKEEEHSNVEIPIQEVKIKKTDPNDPYWNHVEDDSLQLIYDQLRDGAIPESDLSFEFEPKFEPK